MAVYIKQNDTSPYLVATLQDGDGQSIDLTSSSVVFKMRPVGISTPKVDRAAVIQSENSGIVRFEWQSSDTDTMGSYEAEFEVTHSDNTIETFPNASFIRVTITDDIS